MNLKGLLSSDYTERVACYDQKEDLSDGNLAIYFTTIGMEDSDIVYTAMAVKESIKCGYTLNDFQTDDLVANSSILKGESQHINKFQ